MVLLLEVVVTTGAWGVVLRGGVVTEALIVAVWVVDTSTAGQETNTKTGCTKESKTNHPNKIMSKTT